MTVQKALALARALRPCELSDEMLSQFLLELEADLAFRIRGEGMVAPCTAIIRNELSVPAPFDRIYWLYLTSLIDFSMGATERYAVSDALFREARDDYAKWMRRKGGDV